MTIEAIDLFYAIHHCRAMRRLKPDPVPDDLIMKLIDAANQAPTDSNQQHGRWLVVRDPSQKAKLAELNRKGIEGFILATGHYRNGLLLAPATAEILTAVVCGEEAPVDLAPFEVERVIAASPPGS